MCETLRKLFAVKFYLWRRGTTEYMGFCKVLYTDTDSMLEMCPTALLILLMLVLLLIGVV